MRYKSAMWLLTLRDSSKPVLKAVIISAAMLTSICATRVEALELRAMGEDGVLSGPFAAVEGHISLFSDIAEGSLLAGTFGYAARGGYRWCGWGLSLTVEHNMWIATEYDSNVVQGALNVGVGGDFVYADGFIRTALAVGPSILAYDTVLDDAGSVGIYVDIRPAGFRWAVHELFLIGLDPLNFAVVAPVLDRIPLVYIQYRTMIYVEAAF